MEPIFQFELPKEQSSIIKVFGVGGGGSNAVNHMYDQGIIGVNFVVLNTDAQALDMSPIPNKIQLGPASTQGLGAGARPEVGERAAEESTDAIRELLSMNTKMVFVTAGMGGGTGTGAAPVVARIAREMGILTVGIVTTPFWFEGKSRYNSATEGIKKLRDEVDTLLIINNDKIREMYGNLKRSEAFGHANNILTTAAKAISEIITVPGEINVDFADVQTVMKNGGSAIMGCATAEGSDRAITSVRAALNSPLLNDSEIRGARKVLVNITTGAQQVTMDEIGEIMEYVQEAAGSTDIILGTCDDVNLGEKLSVTVIATGFEVGNKQAYAEPVVKKVYELTEKSMEPEVTQITVTPPVAKDEPAVTIQIEQPEADIQPVSLFAETTPEIGLFSISESATTENEVVENTIEFEVSREEQIITETPSLTEETVTLSEATSSEPAPKPEDDFIVYKVKTYETNETISVTPQDMEKELEDRKKVLAGLSYKISSRQHLTDLENEPAYKRKGMNLTDDNNYSTNNEMSRYSVSNDAMGRPEVGQKNTFLHDNVD